MTNEELLKLRENYAAWAEPGDDLDLSEVADDVTKLVNELLATRKRAESVEVQQGMTDGELAAIEARCNAATPGPLEAVRTGSDCRVWTDYGQRAVVAIFPDSLTYYHTAQNGDADAAFHAAARADVPRLIAEVRRLRALLEQVSAYPRVISGGE